MSFSYSSRILFCLIKLIAATFLGTPKSLQDLVSTLACCMVLKAETKAYLAQ